jgi:hypothetical protein
MVTRHALRLAVLFSLCVTIASAQSAPPSAGFGGLTYRTTVVVVDDSGRTTTGRVQRSSPETLTIAVNGQDVVFDRNRVAAVFERGNSMKRGIIFGSLMGPALGIVGVAFGEEPNADLAAGVIGLSAFGVAVLAAVGAFVSKERLIYEKPFGADIFRAIADSRVVIVATDAGETTGQLLRVTDDELTVKVADRDQTFARTQVAAIYERGDSIKNGFMIGFLSGAALGVAAGIRSTCGASACFPEEKIASAIVDANLFGLVGAAVGIAIDATSTGRRLLYEKPKDATKPVVSIVPSFGRSRLGLSTSVSW